MVAQEMYHIYLLKCKDGSIYTGITTDLSRRLLQHKNGKGAKYTRGKGALKILYSELHETRGLAQKREHEIKKMSRLKKLELAKKGALTAGTV